MYVGWIIWMGLYGMVWVVGIGLQDRSRAFLISMYLSPLGDIYISRLRSCRLELCCRVTFCLVSLSRKTAARIRRGDLNEIECPYGSSTAPIPT